MKNLLLPFVQPLVQCFSIREELGLQCLDAFLHPPGEGEDAPQHHQQDAGHPGQPQRIGPAQALVVLPLPHPGGEKDQGAPLSRGGLIGVFLRHAVGFGDPAEEIKLPLGQRLPPGKEVPSKNIVVLIQHAGGQQLGGLPCLCVGAQIHRVLHRTVGCLALKDVQQLAGMVVIQHVQVLEKDLLSNGAVAGVDRMPLVIKDQEGDILGRDGPIVLSLQGLLVLEKIVDGEKGRIHPLIDQVLKQAVHPHQQQGIDQKMQGAEQNQAILLSLMSLQFYTPILARF